jgi:outer membrane protein
MMMRIRKSQWGLSVLAASALAAGAVPAHAVQKGDWLIRAGVGHVAPNDSSTQFSGAPTLKVEEVSSSTNVAINFTYMMTDNVGIELLGALPFKHDIEVTGLGEVGEAKQLPPTLIMLYNFAPKSNVRPYAGAGINYTDFFSVKTKGALAGTDLKLSSSTGLAAEVGVDVDLTKSMFFNTSLWYMKIKTTATSSAAGTADVTIDPWVLFVGVGWRL